MRSPRPMFGSFALLLACAACSDGGVAASPKSAMVFAAASLTAPFEALAADFEREHPGTDIRLNFAGSPQLVMQIREGAAADVFASADEVNMQKVTDAGLAVGAPVTFAKNRLTIVVRTGNPHHIAALADLARADLRVALCGPEVPVGRYARQALAKAAVTVRSSSDEPNVKSLVGKVALGEVDAAIAYTTDARIPGVEAVPIPPEHDVVATYPIVLLGAGEARPSGEAFVAFVRSERGRQVLADHGFLAP